MGHTGEGGGVSVGFSGEVFSLSIPADQLMPESKMNE